MNKSLKKIFNVKSPKIKICCTILYVISVLILHFNGGACPFNRFFNIECPGCGLAAAYLRLFTFDILGAIEENFMFWSVPILYSYIWFDGRLTSQIILDNLILAVIVCGFVIKWICFTIL